MNSNSPPLNSIYISLVSEQLTLAFVNHGFQLALDFPSLLHFAVTLILLWELATALHLLRENRSAHIGNHLFGFSPSVHGFSISLVDCGYLLISSFISVFLHEFGHALAAASEGLQLEYIAASLHLYFLVLLWPSIMTCCRHCRALLPFVCTVLAYGIMQWPNGFGCTFFVTFICVSPGDQILSLDGARINHAQEWMDMTAYINKLSLDSLHSLNQSNYSKGFRTGYSKKGYCVPNYMKDQSNKFELRDKQPICQGYLPVFVETHCLYSSKIDDSSDDGRPGKTEYGYCLNPKEVVKLLKCGHGWMTTNKSSCICSQIFTNNSKDSKLDEFCLSPLQLPGLTWFEITYSNPKCVNLASSSLLPSNSSDDIENKCVGTFVFVGDVISMALSIRLTSYQPRWRYPFARRLPNIIEKWLVCTFHVSLALLNSLPVYFLDGEFMLRDCSVLLHFIKPKEGSSKLSFGRNTNFST